MSAPALALAFQQQQAQGGAMGFPGDAVGGGCSKGQQEGQSQKVRLLQVVQTQLPVALKTPELVGRFLQ